MTFIGRELLWFVRKRAPNSSLFRISSADLSAHCYSPRKSTESLLQSVLHQQWHFRITLPPHPNSKRPQELFHRRQRRLGNRRRIQQPRDSQLCSISPNKIAAHSNASLRAIHKRSQVRNA